jgi:hypothetical protein
METQIIKHYVNYKGGINNLLVVQVVSGFLTLQVFHGKSAMSEAKKWQKKFHAKK